MNFRSFPALFFILISFAVAGLSQNANTNTPAAAPAKPMTESDRIPFMHADEQPEAQEPGSSGLLLKTLGALILVIGLIFAGAWVAKKAGFGNSKTADDDTVELSVLSSVPMGSGRTISSIRFGERILLVGVTSQAFTLLAEDNLASSTFTPNSRSVAEMLAEEDAFFGDEFEKAATNLGIWESRGGSV